MDGGRSWQNTVKIGLPVLGGEKRCFIYLYRHNFDSLSSETIDSVQSCKGTLEHGGKAVPKVE